ncbi:hypothetical protein OWS73_06485 [Burkholderia sp. 1B3(2022)]|uniref:hypothetical protein n=1 Tax=Burkholderia sp. 1B3(2022) TaxID=2997425 RepID=UPI002FC732C8
MHRRRERLAARGGLGPARLADRELARCVAAFAGLTAVAPRLSVARRTLLRLPLFFALLVRAAIVPMAVAMLLPLAVLLIALALLLLTLLVLAFALVRVFVLVPGLERVRVVRPFVSRCLFALRLRRAPGRGRWPSWRISFCAEGGGGLCMPSAKRLPR